MSTIRPAVEAAWIDFNADLEGRAIPWMYLDVKGLVTCGMGNLIDPVAAAVRLPWRMPDGSLATQAQIAADWQALKSQPALAKMHYKYAAPVTKVRLRPEDIDALIFSRLRANAADLTRTFPTFPSWPADAQLATLSMAWAMGSGFPRKWPSWSAHARLGRWAECAANCNINATGNPGVIPRNQLNAAHFIAAALTDDPESLRGPCTLAALKAGAVVTAPATKDPHRPTLRVGSRGEDVRTLQRALGISSDGNFGPLTEAALKRAQASRGLLADGICGPATWLALGL